MKNTALITGSYGGLGKCFVKIHVEKGGDENSITFSRKDLNEPFISFDDAMWNYFEPELAKRLAEVDVDDSVSARVRSALTELLPGGAGTIEDVAEKLNAGALQAFDTQVEQIVDRI